MPRRLVAQVLVLVVQVGAITAPLTHVHLDGHDTDHHHGREIHAHLTGHERHASPITSAHHDGPVVTEDEGDERIAAAPYLVVRIDGLRITVALQVIAAVVAAPDTAPTSRVPRVAHGPDPPALVGAPPRAPPTFLSLT